MTVEWKDMMLDKVAIGPVSARIYQGADYGKGPPIVLYLHGGAFLDSDKNVDRPVAMSLAKAGAIVVAADYSSLSGNVFPKALEVSFSVFTYLANKRAGLGDRKSLLFVAGEEAGGNVAAGVALKARDRVATPLGLMGARIDAREVAQVQGAQRPVEQHAPRRRRGAMAMPRVPRGVWHSMQWPMVTR